MSNAIATAYVQVVPTTEGIGGKLTSALTGEASSAGKSSGSAFSSAFGAAAKIGVGALGVLTASVGACSAAFVKGVSDVAVYGDSIDKASQKLGVSSSFYQEWEAVMQHSGTSMESMTSSFKTLSKAIQNGSKDQEAAFSALGLSMSDLQNMSTEEAFGATINALQQMEEGTERTALASQLLGRGAMEMGALLNTSAEDTQKMIDTVNELGGVMSDKAVKASAAFQDSLQDMQTGLAGLKNNMMAEFLPSVTTMMDGFTDLISGKEGGAQKIGDGIKEMANGIKKAIPSITTALQEIAPVIGEVIMQALPMLANCGLEILKALASGISEQLPVLMQSAGEILKTLSETLIELFPQMVELGVPMLVEFATGIIEALPELIPAIVDMVLSIVNALVDNIDLLVDGAIALVMGLADGILNALPILIEKTPEIMVKIVDAFVRNAPKIVEASKELLFKLLLGIMDNLPALYDGITKVVDRIKQFFKDGFKAMADIGKNIVEGLWNGIKDKTQWLKEKIKEFATGIVDGIKTALKIKSPSGVLRDEVGKWIPEGIAVGIEGNADSVSEAMNSIANSTLDIGTEIPDNIANYSSKSVSSDSALYDLLAKYLPEIASGNNVTVDIQVDSASLFKAVRRENDIYKKAIGSSAFV